MWFVSTLLSLIMSNKTVLWAFHLSPNRTLFKMWLKYSNVDFKKHLTIHYTPVTMKVLLHQCKSFQVATVALSLAYNRSVIICAYSPINKLTQLCELWNIFGQHCCRFTEAYFRLCFIGKKISIWHLTVHQLRQMLFSLFHRQQRCWKKDSMQKAN